MIPLQKEKEDTILKEIYYNPENPASFCGISKLFNAVKKDGRLDISRYRVKKWLYEQDVYTTHSPTFLIFPRRRVYASAIDELYDADLAELPGRFPRANQGVKFLLVVVDVLSRFLFVEPLKFKNAEHIVRGFGNIFKKSSRICSRLRSDKGGDFVSLKLSRFLKSKGIIHYHEKTEKKAAFAERAIKELKKKIYRYINYAGNYKFIHILPKIVKGYNSSYNRIIETSPDKVTSENEHIVWEKTYMNTLIDKYNRTNLRYKFKVGDHCRITHEREVFHKSYFQSHTEEIFTIVKRLKTEPISYLIKDDKKEILKGAFYEKELQKVIVPEDKVYKIEKILNRRQRNNKKEVYVKWEGYSKDYNQWISADEVKNIKK